MNIEYLIQLLNNKLIILNNAKIQAFSSGDLALINSLDEEIVGVNDTISKLKMVQVIDVAAVSANTSSVNLVESGIQAVQVQNNLSITPDSVVLDNPTDVLKYYDITTYATDPLHEVKIADILSFIGQMNTPVDIDIYINNEAIGSPVTGQMIINAANQYSVDARLMMAIMEQDSRFGTAGLAIRTLNPGNVGNNDSGETRTYNSWQEGVNAVAEWLNRHRIVFGDLIIEELPLIQENNLNLLNDIELNQEIIDNNEKDTNNSDIDQAVSVIKQKRIKRVV